jgi:proline iminopeptidase
LIKPFYETKSLDLLRYKCVLFSNCQEKQKQDSIKDNYLTFSKRDDQLTGGIKMIPIKTPKGTFNVWTRVGTIQKIKVLLLHGGPGLTHELYESLMGIF